MSNQSKSLWIFSLTYPDYITLLSFFTGFSSIILLKLGHLYSAMGILFFAMMLDALDGYIARKHDMVRNFGIALDSYVDTVNYLICPSLVLYQAGLKNNFSLVLFSIFYLSGIIRLSVFNTIQAIVENGNMKYRGFPVFWSLHFVGAVLMLQYLDLPVFPWLPNLILLVLSFLFVYNRNWKKFTNMKFITISTLLQGVIFLVLDFI